MNMENNPFKAPEARVEDIVRDAGEFIPDGQTVPAGSGLAWFSRGWEMFRAAPGAWIGLSLTFLIIIVILGMIPVVNILMNLVVPIFIGGMMIGCKAQEEGDDLRVGHLFAGFSGHAGKLALVGVVYLVGAAAIGIATVLVMGGSSFGLQAMGRASTGMLSAAILVPALVATLLFMPLAMALWYAPALVVFHDVAPLQAMKSSFFACLKNILPFLVYGLVFMVLALLASLPIFLGWLVLIPVIQASVYASYRDMFTRS